MVVPGVHADRHAGPVEQPHLVAAQPIRLVQHDGHDEEGRRDLQPLQDRQRRGEVARGGVVEGDHHRTGGQRRTHSRWSTSAVLVTGCIPASVNARRWPSSTAGGQINERAPALSAAVCSRIWW